MEFDGLPVCQQKWVHSFFFLQVPKCASSSIQAIVGERNLIYKHCELVSASFAKHPLYRGVFDTRHLLLSQCFEVFRTQMYDFFSFAVKRNPFSRLESAFSFGKSMELAKLYGLKQDSSFEDFINFLFEAWESGRQDILILREQAEWIFYGNFRVTEVLSFEEIQKDWAKMLKNYSIEGLSEEVPWENRSEKKDILWSKDLKNKVEKIYQKDFDLLGY